MSDVWAKLEGHAVNGEFPLIRHLGGSTHSVVFLTQSAKFARAELALKLVPAVPALAQLQLARWRASAALVHPHLIQIFDAGHCQIGGRHFLYVVTDYADQNLAQLLERRALTEGETREMLAPVLDALASLHDKNLVQGRLKPSNVLVVGDQIRLASDTIRPVSETGRVSNVQSLYLPPEASAGTRTAASDVWGLGVTLCEALTRKQPAGLRSDKLILPPELPEAFRGVVTRCLSPRPQTRPTIKELQVWTRSAQWVASQSAPVPSESGPARPENPVAPSSARRFAMGLAVIVGAVTLFGIGWATIRAPDARPAPVVASVPTPKPKPSSELLPTMSRVTPADAAGTVSQPDSVPTSDESGEAAAVNEVIPEPSQRARQSIRGRVRVSVRLIVDPQGKVFAALVDDAGPSRYFEKLALEAAGQWTFPPATSRQRVMLVRFDFTRQGATAKAIAVE